MSPLPKLLIGLAAALLLGWLHEGPLGSGQAYIDSLEAKARTVVAGTNLTNIDVTMARDPLRRLATLSGPADDFQRNGMGSFHGLTQLVDDVPGVAGVRWADRPATSPFVLPLLAEILLLMCAAYLLGLALAFLFFRRRPEGRYA